jgi:hypothetical protein
MTKQSAKNAGSIAILRVLLGFGIATWALALWNIRYASIVTLKLKWKINGTERLLMQVGTKNTSKPNRKGPSLTENKQEN